MKRTLYIAVIVAILGTAPAGAQIDMTSYVALGDSVTLSSNDPKVPTVLDVNAMTKMLVGEK